jgi:hypothetical protein
VGFYGAVSVDDYKSVAFMAIQHLVRRICNSVLFAAFFLECGAIWVGQK